MGSFAGETQFSAPTRCANCLIANRLDPLGSSSAVDRLGVASVAACGDGAVAVVGDAEGDGGHVLTAVAGARCSELDRDAVFEFVTEDAAGDEVGGSQLSGGECSLHAGQDCFASARQ